MKDEEFKEAPTTWVEITNFGNVRGANDHYTSQQKKFLNT